MAWKNSLLVTGATFILCVAAAFFCAHRWPRVALALAGSQEAPANRLIHEKSPYLLLHAHNPVDWYPWGPEALEKARREQKPIFLSIGYYTCHWCHVMERESYSNPAIAAVLNQSFVAVKVDREERPDVDRLYIAYVEFATGSAGWPLNVLLTPDGKPFFGGTYFPPEQLKSLLEKIADAWAHDRESVLKTGNTAGRELMDIVNEPLAAPANSGKAIALQSAVLDTAFTQIAATYDSENAGFGPAPKFPRPVALEFLFRTYARTGNHHAFEMALSTLRAMARGGIHDQLGGGFHRYSTDAEWRVPHFEKMLYDQAQLAVVYTDAYQVTHDDYFQGVARDILDFSLRELRLPNGGFASALDADSPLRSGKTGSSEGAYYVWTAEEIERVLGKESAAFFDYAYGVKPEGNVAPQQNSRGELAGKNVLWLEHSAQETAKHFCIAAEDVRRQLMRDRAALRQARSSRPRTPIDDKVVTAWNGMLIAALARAGAAFHEPRYLDAAQSTAKFIEAKLYHQSSGRLWRSYRAGSTSVDAFLDDYTDLIGGLLDLYEAGFDLRWLEWAATLQQKQDQLFWDTAAGGFFDATAFDPSLLARTRETYDGAEPAPNSVAAMNLLRLAQFTDHSEWRDNARKTLAAFSKRLESNPEAVPALASALDYSLAAKRQILIAGKPGAPDTLALLRVVNKRYLPDKILLFADGGAGQAQLARWLPFVAGAHPLKGNAAAYICENYICKLPTADPAVAARLLDSKP